jgi:hypothetical protein
MDVPLLADDLPTSYRFQRVLYPQSKYWPSDNLYRVKLKSILPSIFGKAQIAKIDKDILAVKERAGV